MKNNILVHCTSKKRYASKEEAEKVANHLWKEKQVQVNSYRCILCEGYHISSKEKA
jgi:hypothetical protein